MPAFAASSLTLDHLDPRMVSYEPKGIFTEAVLVTNENIGKLSLEFEEELCYSSSPPHMPYFFFSAARRGEKDADEKEWTVSKRLTVRINDWIVPLRGEIHMYPDELFRNTFTFEGVRYDMGVETTLPPVLHHTGI